MAKYFHCTRWRMMMAESACINRYKKGLKKCEGCEKGKALLQLKINNFKLKDKAHGLHSNGN